MDSFRMRFIIGKISDEELLTLKQGEPIISKMLLTPQDYSVFHYKEGDEIEAETVDIRGYTRNIAGLPRILNGRIISALGRWQDVSDH